MAKAERVRSQSTATEQEEAREASSMTRRSGIRVSRIGRTLTIARARIDANRVGSPLRASHTHAISHCLQSGHRGWRKSVLFDGEDIGQPLMMEARRLHRVGDSHVE